MIARETMEVWLRAAAMMASRLDDGELNSEQHLALREHIDRALLILVEHWERPERPDSFSPRMPP